MHYDEFIRSLAENKLPDNLNPALQSLWYDGKDNWDMSHDIAQEIHDNNGSWIHAYLHRKEGDQWNANYWYQRAGRKMPKAPLNQEWEALVQEFLSPA